VTGTDKLQVTLDSSTLVTTLDISTTRASAGVAGTSAAQDTLSGQRGQYIYDTTNSALFINFNADNLLTTADYRINLNPASTATASIVDGDINFVVTGGAGADVITGGAGADTINGGNGTDSLTGGAGADSITGGAGADTIVGGNGADTIVLGAGGDIDRVVYTSTTTAGLTAEAADTITGFTSGEDVLQFAAAMVTNGVNTNTMKVIAKNGTIANNDVFVFINNAAVGDAGGTIAGAVTVLNALTTTAVAIGERVIIALENDTDTFFWLLDQISAADTIAAQDITLIGTLSGITVIANGDMAFV